MMRHRLDLHPAVRDEMGEAYVWYERRSSGLGGTFLDEVNRVLNEILGNPARYGFAAEDIREAQMNRFPYAIYYRESGNRIRILSVFHAARDPAKWQSRS